MMQYIPYIINPNNQCVSHFTKNETNEILIVNDETDVREFLKEKVKKLVEFKVGGEKAFDCLYDMTIPQSKIPDGYYGLIDWSNNKIVLYNKSTGYISTSNDVVVIYTYEMIKSTNVVNNLAESIIATETKHASNVISNTNNKDLSAGLYDKLVEDLKKFDITQLKKSSGLQE